jgi:DNA-binding winged helix-turn-helix (wHTH) protein
VVVHFTPFVLDQAQRRLTRGGQPLHVTPKAFDLLVLLVGAAPRVVPKAEIHDRIWPGTYVSDATLVGLVKELRRVLDDAGRPSRIRTVHRIGYAFDAPLDRDVGPRDPQGGAQPSHWLVLDDETRRLNPGATIIGREVSADVTVAVSGVSRRHARIVVIDGVAIIEDLGSKNGTRVRGLPVLEATPLQNGDVVQFGPATAVYRTGSDNDSTMTQVE